MASSKLSPQVRLCDPPHGHPDYRASVRETDAETPRWIPEDELFVRAFQTREAAFALLRVSATIVATCAQAAGLWNWRHVAEPLRIE